MATTADFRNGLVIEFNHDLFTIIEFQHVKPGKGPRHLCVPSSRAFRPAE